jgi:hypothetical protein
MNNYGLDLPFPRLPNCSSSRTSRPRAFSLFGGAFLQYPRSLSLKRLLSGSKKGGRLLVSRKSVRIRERFSIIVIVSTECIERRDIA